MSAATRPVPPFAAPPDWRWEAQPDPHWRPVDGTGKRCRQVEARSTCNARAVIEDDRSRGERPGGQWRPVCPQHAFGRWLEGDQVMSWVLR